MLGLVFHPGYVTNGYFYVFYSGSATNGTSGLHDILSRFKISSGNTNQGDPTSETQLIVQYDRASNHNGGDLHFGPDGYLYVALGDEGSQDNVLLNALHIDSIFFSGILRLDVDKNPGSLAPNPNSESASTTNYAVPSDNPFVGVTSFDNLPVIAGQLRTEFWAVGFRNPWRFSFDSTNLYCGDVGQVQFEEVDLVTKGGNYGWSTFEGSNSPASGVNTNGQPVPVNPIYPVIAYAHGSTTNQGNAVIGGVVYHGSRLPQLNGNYIYADETSGNVWRLSYDGVHTPVSQYLFNDKTISCFGIDPGNGDVLYAKLNAGNNSVIQRIISTNTIPVISSVKISGANFIASGIGGPNNGTYLLLTSTNLTFPAASWTHAATNPFDAGGNFIFTNPIDPGVPVLFYLLQLQ
jgi:glucose/arabinose dehydrogenase